MTETNQVVENVETVEYPVIPKAYSVSDKGNVTMTKDTRDYLRKVMSENRESVDLTDYELVDNNYLTKQVAVCGETGLPVRVTLKISYTNNHPSDLAKKGKSTSTEKKTTVYKVSL